MLPWFWDNAAVSEKTFSGCAGMLHDKLQCA